MKAKLKREIENLSFPVHFLMAKVQPGWNQELHENFPHGCRGWSTLTIVYCLPRLISMKWDQRWSSWNWNLCSYGMSALQVESWFTMLLYSNQHGYSPLTSVDVLRFINSVISNNPSKYFWFKLSSKLVKRKGSKKLKYFVHWNLKEKTFPCL